MRRPLAVAPPDLDALLSALVLAPMTFARNRFHWLYDDPAAKRVRMRAAQLRGIVRQLAERGGAQAVVLEAGESGEGDRRVLRYRVPSLELERTALFERLEDALVRYALQRAGVGSTLPLDEADRQLVEAVIARLAVGLVLDAPEPSLPTGSFGSGPADD